MIVLKATQEHVLSVLAALLSITHLPQGGQGSDPAQRVICSIAFTAVARVLLVAAQVQALLGIHASRIEWGAAVQGPARERAWQPLWIALWNRGRVVTGVRGDLI